MRKDIRQHPVVSKILSSKLGGFFAETHRTTSVQISSADVNMQNSMAFLFVYSRNLWVFFLSLFFFNKKARFIALSHILVRKLSQMSAKQKNHD